MKKTCALGLSYLLLAAIAFPQSLFNLAQSGTPADIQSAIQAGAKIDARDANGLTPLMYAAANPNPEAIAVLLRAGAKVDDRTNAGATPLMIAAKLSSSTQVISALLKAGAAIEARDNTGTTPLMYAGGNTNPEIVSVLLKAGAKVDDRNSFGFTPLMSAAQGNQTNPRAIASWQPGNTHDPEIIALLLNAGARVDEQDNDGSTALMYAGMNPDAEVISVLVQAGARINARSNGGMTPLMAAAWKTQHVEVIAALMQNKADIRAADQRGYTAFDYARANEQIKIYESIQTPRAGNMIINQIFFELVKSGTPSEVQFALQSGAAIDMVFLDNAAPQPLILAAGYNQDPEVISVLLKAGAKIDETNAYGMTPLMYAARHNPNPEIISALLKAGADAKRKDMSSETAFDYAQENQKLKGTKQLLDLKKASE